MNKKSVTDLTRRNIFDYLTMERVAWAGRLEETQFIVRVWPNAADLPSYDTRWTPSMVPAWAASRATS